MTRTPTCCWGLRGGGGNFGVVTEFEFGLHPVGPIVMGGMLAFPRAAGARDRARLPRLHGAGVRSGVRRPGDDHRAARGLRSGGGPRASRRWASSTATSGPPEEGAEALRPLREALPDPVLDMVQPMPYTALQQMLDAGNPHGIREYFKVDYLRELPDEAIDVDRRTGGAAARTVRPADPRPDGGSGGPDGQQRTRAEHSRTRRGPTSACRCGWTRPRTSATRRGRGALPRRCGRSGSARRLPNFIEPDEGNARLRASYGEDKYARLVALKEKWDPDNLFRLNQNIAPAA